MATRRLRMGWSLNDEGLVLGANVRVALALLRCCRDVRGAIGERQYDEVGEALMPALVMSTGRLRQSLNSSRSTDLIRMNVEHMPLHELVREHAVHSVLGEALCQGHAEFDELFEQTEQGLLAIIHQNPHPCDRNARMLGDLMGLSEVERIFLSYVSAQSFSSIPSNLFSHFNAPSALSRALASMCDCSLPDAEKLLDPKSALCRSGVLRHIPKGSFRSFDLEDLMSVTSLGMRLLSLEHDGLDAMTAVVLEPWDASAEAGLNWEHMKDARCLMTALLKNASCRREKGVNVLIHGAPGTGKTQFVKQILSDSCLKAYVIDHRNADGEEASRQDRMAHLMLTRKFSERHGAAVLVVDEAEDIFTGDHRHEMGALLRDSSSSKAWMNDILETNLQPVVWISNSVSHMDPAYLRRFTYCVEFPNPPLSLRQELVRDHLKPLGCSDSVMEAIAAQTSTTAAVIQSTARFAALTADSGLQSDVAALAAFNGHLIASTGSSLASTRKRDTGLRFDLSYLNFAGAMSPSDMLAWLKGEGAGTCLFAGPPGTGKTYLAKELAKLLDRQIVVKTASDINSKWYGESERNVAAMFRSCDPQREVLFLDEGDVLLGHRDTEHGQRADKAVTAEFLRWLEEFDGVFICATNLASTLDPAMSRRFTHRVEFLPLTVKQRRALFAELVLGDSKGELPPHIVAGLSALHSLTPGDFANVKRRLTRTANSDQNRWLEELAREQLAKTGESGRRAGFF